jgi:NAD(P)-dependent dehydrogenase (short-subunit alcohol dehydrogenase family)
VKDRYRVFGTARKPPAPEVDRIAMLPLDVCDDGSVARCVAAVIERGGGLDVLVNNAGFLLASAVEEATIDEAKAQLETNFYKASKFAVEGLLETLRHEVKPFGIQVAMVEPGAIKTPFYAQPSATPMAAYATWRAARLFTFLRWLLAAGPFEAGVRNGFKMPK